jgi:ATP-dependent exoDNAse (exonuclease V) beta subunit
VALYHEDDDTRMLDVSGSGPQWRAHADAHLREDAGEELRDLYVALTRAQSQVVTWWAPTFNTPGGGLHRLLFGRQPGQAEVPDSQDVRDDDYVARVLGMLAELGGPEPEVAVVPEVTSAIEPGTVGRLAARHFDREVDTEWRRTTNPRFRTTTTALAFGLERGCCRRWRTCRQVRPSAAWSTVCWSWRTPKRATSLPRLRPGPASSCPGGRSVSARTSWPRP